MSRDPATLYLVLVLALCWRPLAIATTTFSPARWRFPTTLMTIPHNRNMRIHTNINALACRPSIPTLADKPARAATLSLLLSLNPTGIGTHVHHQSLERTGPLHDAESLNQAKPGTFLLAKTRHAGTKIQGKAWGPPECLLQRVMGHTQKRGLQCELQPVHPVCWTHICTAFSRT